MIVAIHLILKTDGRISLLSVVEIWKVYNVYTLYCRDLYNILQQTDNNTHSVSEDYQWVLRFNGYALMREFRNSTIYHYLGLIYKLNSRLPTGCGEVYCVQKYNKHMQCKQEFIGQGKDFSLINVKMSGNRYRYYNSIIPNMCNYLPSKK